MTGLTPGTSYTFKVAAINAAGTGPPSAASAAVTVNAGPSLTFGPPPAGEVSIAYSDQLTATGRHGRADLVGQRGSLPPGLTLNSTTGLLSGTPTTARQLPVHRQGHRHHRGHRHAGRHPGDRRRPVAGQPGTAAGQAGVAYSDALAVTGGTGPFTWAVSGGQPPARPDAQHLHRGAVRYPDHGRACTSFTVKVTDSFGLTATQSLNLTVAVGPLVISATANASTVAQGGTLGYTVTITNTAASAYSGVTFSVPLGNVLDDAAYNSDAAATAGTVSFASPT